MNLKQESGDIWPDYLATEWFFSLLINAFLIY